MKVGAPKLKPVEEGNSDAAFGDLVGEDEALSGLWPLCANIKTCQALPGASVGRGYFKKQFVFRYRYYVVELALQRAQ